VSGFEAFQWSKIKRLLRINHKYIDRKIEKQTDLLGKSIPCSKKLNEI
jgi:hypothetical protein